MGGVIGGAARIGAAQGVRHGARIAARQGAKEIARASARQIARSAARASARQIAKTTAKSMAKAAAKRAAKAAAKAAAKKSARAGAKTIAKKSARAIAKETAKKTAKVGAKKVAKTTVKQSLVNSLGQMKKIGAKELSKKAGRIILEKVKEEIKDLPKTIVKETFRAAVRQAVTKTEAAILDKVGRTSARADNKKILNKRLLSSSSTRNTRHQSGGFASFGVMRLGDRRGVTEDPIRYDGYKWYEDIKRDELNKELKRLRAKK